MTSKDETEQFVALLTQHQTRLLRFIRAMVPDPDRASDVLQETNLVLWRKASDFEKGTDFWAWASQVAFFQVKAYWRDQGRDRHAFDDKLLAQLAEIAEVRLGVSEERTDALRKCLRKLPSENRKMVRQRYVSAKSITELAIKLDKSPNAVSIALHRTRTMLLNCIQGVLGGRNER